MCVRKRQGRKVEMTVCTHISSGDTVIRANTHTVEKPQLFKKCLVIKCILAGSSGTKYISDRSFIKTVGISSH